jgi:polyvinyl alcohol dehydrogenase (cytochrome)
VVALACSSQGGESPATTTAARGSHADSGNDAAWTTYRHDDANTGYAPRERSITPDNVSSLHVSWSRGGLTGVTGTPAVVNGVVYFGDWKGNMWAVSASSGATRWHTPLPGGFIVGAPTVARGGVFIGNGHTLYRLDADTGRIVWHTSTNEHPLAQINASPVVVDNLVIQATAGVQDAVPDATNSFRGTIGAYDADTGRQVWRFYTTPANARAGSGVGVWSTAAVDRHRGLIFVGTGNTSSEPTAPLGDALLAIDYRTGTLRWSRQFTARDVFPKGHPVGKDVDVGASPNLWTSDGHDMVGVGDKGGTYHALDRDTGKVVWQRSLTPGSAFGGVIGSAAFVDGRLVMSSNVGNPETNGSTNHWKLFAIDPATGRIQWSSSELAGEVFGPVTAVHGVAFVGTDAGDMNGFSVADGRRLWTHHASGKVGGGAAIVDGRVVWGYGFFLFSGPSNGGIESFVLGR